MSITEVEDPALRAEWDRTAKKERRERIATAVLAGFAACSLDTKGPAWEVAIAWADGLIAELDKKA